MKKNSLQNVRPVNSEFHIVFDLTYPVHTVNTPYICLRIRQLASEEISECVSEYLSLEEDYCE